MPCSHNHSLLLKLVSSFFSTLQSAYDFWYLQDNTSMAFLILAYLIFNYVIVVRILLWLSRWPINSTLLLSRSFINFHTTTSNLKSIVFSLSLWLFSKFTCQQLETNVFFWNYFLLHYLNVYCLKHFFFLECHLMLFSSYNFQCIAIILRNNGFQAVKNNTLLCP